MPLSVIETSTGRQLEEDFQGYSLVIPSLGVGNVGQLSVDILLASMQPKMVAAIQHPSLLPAVGSDPLVIDSDRLMTACEVFKSEESKLLIIQIRSSVTKTGKASFVDDVLEWATQAHLDKIIVLSSMSAEERVDSQMSAETRFLVNNSDTIRNHMMTTLGLIELEKKDKFPSMIPGGKDETQLKNQLYIPGGGLSKAFHNKSEDIELPVVSLLTFASEGDNTGDALRLVALLDKWLGIIPKMNERPALKFPVSWNHMFGNPAPTRIY